MAASYLNSLVNNHAFVDGNKRTALATVSVFLQLNAMVLDERNEDELVDFVVRVASEKVSNEEIVAFLEPRILVPEIEGKDA
jgi:death-on-curing protein